MMRCMALGRFLLPDVHLHFAIYLFCFCPFFVLKLKILVLFVKCNLAEIARGPDRELREVSRVLCPNIPNTLVQSLSNLFVAK